MADVGRILENVGPDVVEQVVQRVLATETRHTDGHVTDGRRRDLKHLFSENKRGDFNVESSLKTILRIVSLLNQDPVIMHPHGPEPKILVVKS